MIHRFGEPVDREGEVCGEVRSAEADMVQSERQKNCCDPY